MKIMKYLTMGLLFIGMTTLMGCKKEDMSKYATKDDLKNYQPSGSYATTTDNQSKVVNFNITFTPTQAWGAVPYIEKKDNDIVLIYVHYDDLGGSATWAQLPLVSGQINYVSEYTDNSIYINAKKTSDDSYYYFASNTTIGFKAVVLSFSEVAKKPNVNLKDYKEVSKAFNIE